MFTTRPVTSTYWSLNIFQHPDLNIFFAYFGATIVRGYRLVRESQIKIVVGTLRTTTNDATFRVYRDNDFCRFLFLFFLGRSKEILEIGFGWEKVVIRLDWWEIMLKGSFYLWIKKTKILRFECYLSFGIQALYFTHNNLFKRNFINLDFARFNEEVRRAIEEGRKGLNIFGDVDLMLLYTCTKFQFNISTSFARKI